jgi:hypothetical protein
MVTINKGRPFEEVLGKVAAKAKFRKNGKVGPSLPGFLRQTQDASRISCEIAYRGIELRQRYLHARTLEYGCEREIANTAEICCAWFIGNTLDSFFWCFPPPLGN